MAKIVKMREAFRGRNSAAEIKEVTAVLKEEIEAGKLTLDVNKASDKVKAVSIRDLAEAALGSDAVQKYLDPSHGGEGTLVEDLREAVDPVRLSAFTNITGQLIVRQAYEAYTSPTFIGDQLVTAETDREDNVRIAGLMPIDDDALEVGEGEEYPVTKFGEDYIDRPSSKKRGLRIGLTKELVFFDRTGKLVEMATGVGARLGMNKEKRILRVFLGIDNAFTRKGVARNTYVASADPRINKLASNELVDWTDVDNAMQLFNLYTDDRTAGDGAEPISVMPDTMVVTQAYAATASRILHATEVRHIASGSGIETISSNPLGGIKLLTSPMIQWMLNNSRHGNIATALAKKHWYLGQPKKAFRYCTLFPFSVEQQSGGTDEFDRDVVASWKASERGVAYTYAPWYNAELYDT